MIGSDGAEEEKRKSRGQYSGAGGEQPNVKGSLLFVCHDDERLLCVFEGKKKKKGIAALEQESGPESDLSNSCMTQMFPCQQKCCSSRRSNLPVCFQIASHVQIPSTLHCTKSDPTHLGPRKTNSRR